MKNLFFTFLLSFSLVLILGLGKAYAAEVTIVSDTTTTYWDGDSWEPSAVAWKHPSWSMIAGSSAIWIWNSEQTQLPRAGETVEFQKTFYIPGIPIGGEITSMTADNTYSVLLNNNLIGTGDSWKVFKTHEFDGFLQQGLNTLKITVVNSPYNTDDYTVNPGGLIYDLTYEYDPIVLEDPEQTGYNVNNGDDASTPRLTNEIACNGGYTNINGISVHWTDVADGNSFIKYYRQYSTNGTSWGGSEIYTNPYTNYRTFGGGTGTEGKYYSRVRSFYDINQNGLLDGGELYSGWSNTCDITYDITSPQTPTGLQRRSLSYEIFECGDLALRQILIPEWDAIAALDFSHYEYSSFNPNGSQGLNESKLNTNEMVHSWVPPVDGTYGYAVRAVDKAGNKSAWALTDETLAGSCQITYDSTPPIVDITNPLDKATIGGTVELQGTVIEEHPGHYNISLYKDVNNTCDDIDIPYTWDFTKRLWQETVYNDNTVNHSLDTSPYADGTYLIRLAARDLLGNRDPMVSSDTGVSVEVICVTIDNDADDDGVKDWDDMCPGTLYDSPSDGLGTNRWQYTETGWITMDPNGRGPKASYEIADTLGCSCDQILNRLEVATGEEFEGHHKFGCSKSILEEWIAGEYPMSTVIVPAGGLDYLNLHTATTPFDTISGEYYRIEASGMYTYMSSALPTYGQADAEYSNRPSWTYGPGWILGDNVFPTGKEHALDLTIDGENISWGTYNESHTYSTILSGTDNPFIFDIFDDGYGDNSGYLTADVFVKLW